MRLSAGTSALPPNVLLRPVALHGG